MRFTTREGSWLSFDVSPDRRWIVFDLLGQLWRLPIRGGVATPLTDVVRDSAELVDPRFAPDGATVLAHGEYRGRVGVFGIDVATRTVRWVAADSIRSEVGHLALHTPAWHSGTTLLSARPASRASDVLIVRDFETGRESELRVDGVSEPGRDAAAYAPDGVSVFFNTLRPWDARVTYPGAGRIWRVPIAGGLAQPVSPAAVRARGATPAPDGRRIAYFVLDSASRAQVWLQALDDSVGRQLTHDADVTPTRLAWLTRDTLVYVESGRLWKLDVRSRRRQAIPFEATVAFDRRMPALAPVRFAAAGDTVRARTVNGFAPAPDGESVVTLLGTRLWVSDARPGAVARVVATIPVGAAAPHWSPDGRRIVWFAGAFGEENLFVTDTVKKRTTQLTALPGAEIAPMWSPDGQRLLFRYLGRDSAGRGTSELRVVALPNIAVDSAIRGLAATVSLGAVGSPADGKPRWSPDGRAVVVLGPAGNAAERPATIRFVDGTAPRAVRGLPAGASGIQWVAGDTLVFLHAMRLMAAHLDVATGRLSPPAVLADDPATGVESTYRGDLLYPGEDGFRLRSVRPSHGDGVRRLGWPVRYIVPVPPPLLVRNVRVIDGTGAPASAPRDVLIEGGRITRVSPAGTVRVAPDARVLDAAGRTAMPGLIDLHSHHRTPTQLRGLLAYGVTTVRNVGCDAPAADAVASGDWLGSRVVAANLQVETDWPFTRGGCAGTSPESDPEQIERVARMIPGVGSAFAKLHSNSGWAQQMRVVAAAHARGARVTGHCAYPLALVAAGIDSKEHLGWQCTMHDVGTWYDDLIQLYRAADVPIVPTLALFLTSDRQRGARVPVPTELAGLFGELERTQIAQSLNFRSLTAANTLDLGHAMDAAGRLHRAGVRLGAGTDFERPDGLHYELEALVEASLSPLAAIRAATSDAARIMGADREIGRIAPGLLGDLVIVDGDPGADIRDARRVWQVVQGGHVVDRERLRIP